MGKEITEKASGTSMLPFLPFCTKMVLSAPNANGSEVNDPVPYMYVSPLAGIETEKRDVEIEMLGATDSLEKVLGL
jgi:hypothetical protein